MVEPDKITPVLIGRTREIEFLVQALRATQNGAGRCILLVGEAGIGKSRLAAELSHRAAAEHFMILQGHCSEQDISYPYAPWVDALRAFLAPRSAVEVSELLGAFASELVKLLPELSLLIPSIQPTSPLDPEAEKHRLFETLVRLTASFTAAHPLLIVLEDMHWGDEQSLILLQFFVRRLATLPILILCTYRIEEPSPRLTRHLVELNRERQVDEIRLAPLIRQDVEQMVRSILKTERPIAADWVDFLMPLTEGNPFFIEEILKSLAETGIRQGSLDQLQIPRSIQHTVLRRVDQLPESTRNILSLAAVIGERFDFGLLKEISAHEEQILLHHLKEMVSAQLIVEASAEQFAFRHAITREAVYTGLLLRERQALHRQIAETMERFWGPASSLHPAELAYHFVQAAVWDKALQYSQSAGEQAQKLYALREALAHFTHAIKAAERLNIPPSLSILRNRARAYELLSEFDPARADYERALELARHEEDRVGEWATLIDLGFLWQSRDLVRAYDYYEHGLQLAQTIGEPMLIAPSLNRIGNWHTNRGQPREALSYHRQALELYRQMDDPRGVAQTLELLGVASYFVGEIIQGVGYCEKALPILGELDDRQGLVNTLVNLSLPPRFDTEVQGEIDLHRLVSLSETAVEIARRSGWRRGEAEALNRIAACLGRAGDYGRGLEIEQAAMSIAEESQHRQTIVTGHLAYGIELYPGLFAYDEAREHLEKALQVAGEFGSVLLKMVSTAWLAVVCVRQKDFAGAQALLEPVLHADLPDAAEMPILLRSCWCARAELDLARGSPQHGLEIIDRLLSGTMNLKDYGPYAVPRLAWLRGKALAGLDRSKEAVPEFQGAIRVAEKQGQRPMVWRIRTDLGKAYLKLGHRKDAQEQFSFARAMVHDIADHLPDGRLRDQFTQQAYAWIPSEPKLTRRRAVMKEFGGLTERERQVAEMIAQGKSNREIAEKLVVTVRTVEVHITHILNKLDFESRVEIAAWVVRGR